MEPLYLALYALIVVCTLYILFSLLSIGKPSGLTLNIHGFLDSYEQWDDKKGAKVKAPYLHWKGNIPITAEVSLRYRVKQLRWGRNLPIPIKIKLLSSNLKLPDGLELQTRQEEETFSVGSVGGRGIILKCYSNKLCSFLIDINHPKDDFRFSQIEECSFTLEVSYRTSRFLFFRSKNTLRKQYNFFVGPYLGKVWVAFDPGTYGSCVATGSESKNLTIEQTAKGDKIMPSYLAFDRNKPVRSLQDIENIEKTYEYGEEALGRAIALDFKASDRIFFNSIKKLLGFKDKKPLSFLNNYAEEVSGTYLTYLLVKGMFTDLNNFINNKKQINEDLLSSSDGSFAPLRAIVAVPNNATAFKIRDMVAAINRTNQFKEIRYISEAEAVLCYYIYKYPKRRDLNEGESIRETVFIFDMGGATINTAIADITQEMKGGDHVYDIEIESKIGYGIGGDTIDYCLIRYFFQPEFVKYYKIPHDENPFSETLDSTTRRALRKKAQVAIFDVKKSMIDFYQEHTSHTHSNYQPTSESILLDLSSIKLFYTKMSIEADIKSSDPIYQAFLADPVGEFPFFEDPLFQKYVYEPVAEAVKDTLALSKKGSDTKYTLLFSGRSILFPLIKDTIRNNVSKKINQEIALDESELKTAVVKGACWYAVNRQAIQLSSLRTHTNIGFKRTISADTTHLQFYNLIEAGTPFKEDEAGLFCSNSVEIQNAFRHDSQHINFYQVMGNNPQEVIVKDQKHKYAKVHQVELQTETKEVAIQLRGDDLIEYDITLLNGTKIAKEKKMEEMELVDANEEHYTWLVE